MLRKPIGAFRFLFKATVVNTVGDLLLASRRVFCWLPFVFLFLFDKFRRKHPFKAALYTRLFPDPRFLLSVLQNIAGFQNAVVSASMKWRYLGYLQLLSKGVAAMQNGGQPTRGDG